MKCTISKKKTAHNEWNLKFNGLTEGMIMSMVNGMKVYVEETGSPVGGDVHQFIKNAYEEEKFRLGKLTQE